MTFIYVDGSYFPDLGLASIGIPHKQLSIKVKAYDSLSAELIAVIRGLQYANNYDTVCTDCLVIVNAIKRTRLILRHEFLCVHLFRLLDTKRHVRVVWVKRERNRKADKLARDAVLK